MSLLRYIAEVADEPFVLDPANPVAEERENTWRLDCPAEEREALATVDVVKAFENCAVRLGDRLPADARAIFYVWHDQQAGQLRCSTSSQSVDQLPFRSRVVQSPLEPIIEEFLAAPGLIPWQDLQEDAAAPEPGEWTIELELWHVRLQGQ